MTKMGTPRTYVGQVEVEIGSSEIIDWVANYFKPDDIYSEQELSEWAERNGFVKADQ